MWAGTEVTEVGVSGTDRRYRAAAVVALGSAVAALAVMCAVVSGAQRFAQPLREGAENQIAGRMPVRAARRAGASWAQIGAAGISKQSAWEAHTRWIDEQAAQHGQSGHEGFDAQDEVAARALAGDSADESAD
jgi:hypothetical protein